MIVVEVERCERMCCEICSNPECRSPSTSTHHVAPPSRADSPHLRAPVSHALEGLHCTHSPSSLLSLTRPRGSLVRRPAHYWRLVDGDRGLVRLSPVPCVHIENQRCSCVRAGRSTPDHPRGRSARHVPNRHPETREPCCS